MKQNLNKFSIEKSSWGIYPKYKPILVIVAAPIAIVRANGNDFSKTVVKKFPFTCSKLASYVKKNVGIPTPQVLIKESWIGSNG